MRPVWRRIINSLPLSPLSKRGLKNVNNLIFPIYNKRKGFKEVKMEEFDVAIIGAGSGGYVAAIRAADLGKKVVIIEHREIGGTCLNRGCIPTKALLKIAEVYTSAKESKSFGITVENVSFDPNAIQKRKDAVIRRLVAGIDFLFKSRKIVVKKGNGKLLDEHTIEITGNEGTEKIKAKDIIIATGSEPAMIPAFKIDRKNVLTSDEALNLTEYPKNMLIVGAGAIGIEFATILSAFGTKVTIVEMMPQVVPTLKDIKLASMVQRMLVKKGIEIKTGIKIDNIEIQGNGNVVSTLSSGEELITEKVLVSIGRKLNSTGIGIEELSIKTEKGKILVDEKLRTNIPNIYAIGDVIGGLLLAHKAQKEGDIVAEIIAGKDKKMDYRVVPWAIFSSPEIARSKRKRYQYRYRGIPVHRKRKSSGYKQYGWGSKNYSKERYKRNYRRTNHRARSIRDDSRTCTGNGKETYFK
jgi:dihydrolipoamide dehydrogenase